VQDRTNVAVFNTLSKRSSMPGYRAGFVAGDPAIVAALKKYRPNVGVAPPEFFQRAAVAAWNEETHVTEVRERYRVKRELLLPALEALGLRSAGGDASFFLWMEGSEALAAEWLERGVIVAPGSYFGPAGEGYLRIALVPQLDAIERAIERLST
jgi:acetylornithine aminotransferase